MVDKKNPWKTLSSKVVYKNSYFKISENKVIKPNGTRGMYGIIHIPPSAMIAAVTDKEEIYLIGQFRYISDKYSLELPSGASDGEKTLGAAQRELQEETGLKAKSWKEIATFYPSSGRMSEFTHVFLAQGLEESDTHEKESEGIKEVIKVPFKEALEMVRSGKIHDGQTIIGIVQAAFTLGIL